MSRSITSVLTMALISSSLLFAQKPPAKSKNDQVLDDDAAVVKMNEKVVKKVQFLVNPGLIEVNVDNEVFLKEISKVSKILKPAAEKYQLKDCEGKLKITYFKDKLPEFHIETMPKMTEGQEKSIIADLTKSITIKSKYFSMAVNIYFQIGKGSPNGKKIKLELSEHDQRVAKIKAAGIVEANKIIQQYVREKALPGVVAFLLRSDPKFEGVHGMGEMLNKLDFSKEVDVKKIIDENALYWRGCIEMSRNNTLVSSTRIFLHAANGNFDRADKYLSIHLIFSDKKSTSTVMLGELNELIAIHNVKVQAEIDKGIKLHDQLKFDEAAQVYQALLEKYPYSAHGTYELWFAKSTKKLLQNKGKNKEGQEGVLDEDFKSWKAARKKIYAIDPLYNMDVRSRTPREQFMLLRRVEMKELLSKRMSAKGLVTYADIAKDFGVYNFSAELYFIIMSNLKKENYAGRDLLGLYVYCAYQAGAKDFSKLFKYDIDAMIKEQQQDLENRIHKKK